MANNVGKSSFRASHLPNGKTEYVAWVDTMGTRMVTTNISSKIASTNICKLYDAAIRAETDNEVRGYPMGDGMFLTSPNGDTLYSNLERIFSYIVDEILERYQHDHDFELIYMPVIKGVITSGTVYHGSEINGSALDNHEFTDSLVFGKPLVDAVEMEIDTPPFGLTFHESASPTSAREAYKWWSDDRISQQLWGVLKEYYDLCTELSDDIGYPVKKIKRHRQNARWYLIEA